MLGLLKGCKYKPTMGCDAERKKIYVGSRISDCPGHNTIATPAALFLLPSNDDDDDDDNNNNSNNNYNYSSSLKTILH